MGPTVWELLGPIPILNRSKVDITACSGRGIVSPGRICGCLGDSAVEASARRRAWESTWRVLRRVCRRGENIVAAVVSEVMVELEKYLV